MKKPMVTVSVDRTKDLPIKMSVSESIFVSMNVEAAHVLTLDLLCAVFRVDSDEPYPHVFMIENPQ